ncbi:lipopolysaccharide biosynthesis protein [Cloacibacterium sp. TD35]|uniref:lipopolysaccharide biosynthesis protein n=1 Tax=Cloacibacterium sp. TD35 TaxID=2976818 RepID=UPI00237E4ADC|nr:oligosaccharide flippase family protein [Cloacibacterium sp. TD35]WDT67054.1 oligosaccharide flippase family protein [Cloacibacterium sp. TD35]
MSVVARQSFKYSIIGYLGFLLGTVSAIFIFPFDMVFYGKLRFVLSATLMLVPFVVFGLSYSNVYFFGKAKEEGKHQNLFSLSLVGVGINFLIFLFGFFAFFYIFSSFQEDSELWDMKRLILPMVLVMSLSAVFNRYISNFKRIVVPNIFENIFPKLANLGAFCLFFFLGASEKISYGFFLGVFVLGLIGYILYTNKLEKISPDFSTDFVKKDKLWKEILNYSFYGFLGNLGSFLALNISNYMIGEKLSFEENGIYSTVFSVVQLISIPSMGLYNISAPIISKHFADNTIKELDVYYKKTSLSLFFLGLVLFSCIAVGYPYLTDFMPKSGKLLLEAQPLVWVIGFALLFELATGFNSHIISMSKYYRFNIYVMLFLAVLTTSLNFYFINKTSLGILGISISYAVSLTIFNLTKIAFNYYQFKVSPFTIEMLYSVILATLAISVAIVLPNFSNSFLNLVYKPALVLIIFFVGNHFMRIYPLDKFLTKDFLKSLFKF